MKIETAIKRRDRIQKIRSFFMDSNCLEVDVPLLGRGVGTDPYLDFFKTEYGVFGQKIPLYFHTSPEFFLKRLLAEGYPDIYYMGPTFRNGESGQRHSPQFTILEWYRLGFTLEELKEEIIRLIIEICPQYSESKITQISYRDLFKKVNLNPAKVTIDQIQKVIGQLEIPDLNIENRLEGLDYIFSQYLEPNFIPKGICVVNEYLPEQAALAKISKNKNGVSVADRFEIYLEGIEIANAYSELTSEKTQLERFKEDQIQRDSLLKPDTAIDYNFLKSLKLGLPSCSGVALGVDRLIMISLGLKNIDEVQTFKFENW